MWKREGEIEKIVGESQKSESGGAIEKNNLINFHSTNNDMPYDIFYSARPLETNT